jgi:copper oxidase (laccase) domain-containing protein
MGPAIAGEVYQVSEEVAAKVGASCLSGDEKLTPAQIIDSLMGQDEPPILPDAEMGKVRLDVRRINFLQLVQLGILPDQIAIAPYCTYQQPDYFFSYRRTQQKQVQWSGIVSF